MEAGPAVVLLRVMAEPPRRRAEAGERPVLVTDDGWEIRRFAALPAPADARGALRAAYSVPREAFTPQTVFSLQLADGHVVSLPKPTPGTARLTSSTAGAEGAGAPSASGDDNRAAAPEREARAAAESLAARAQEEAQALQRRVAALEAEAEAIRRERQADPDAVRRVREAEEGRERARAELQELEVWCAELERRLADAATELGAAQAQMRQDAEELARLRQRLAEAEARAQAAEPTTRAQTVEHPPPGPGGTVPDLEELTRRAAARASAVAARELARALAETPPNDLSTP